MCPTQTKLAGALLQKAADAGTPRTRRRRHDPSSVRAGKSAPADIHRGWRADEGVPVEKNVLDPFGSSSYHFLTYLDVPEDDALMASSSPALSSLSSSLSSSSAFSGWPSLPAASKRPTLKPHPTPRPAPRPPVPCCCNPCDLLNVPEAANFGLVVDRRAWGRGARALLPRLLAPAPAAAEALVQAAWTHPSHANSPVILHPCYGHAHAFRDSRGLDTTLTPVVSFGLVSGKRRPPRQNAIP